MKAKINEGDCIKLKSFARQKKPSTKRQPIEWEKIFANNTSYWGPISKIHKEFIQLNNSNTELIKKWAEDLNRNFAKEDIQMADI